MIDCLFIAAGVDIPGPGIITVLGMGTVFVCLTLIYIIMALLSRFLGVKGRTPDSAKFISASAVEGAGVPGHGEFEGHSGGDTPPPEIIAAIGVALGRHRKAKSGAAPAGLAPEARVSAWRLAARMNIRRV